jgi:hypothetical protein
LFCPFVEAKVSASSGRPEHQEETTMQKQTFRLASLCLLLTFASALVQAQSRITVQVPFHFVASDRTFPAGRYSVSASGDKLTLQDATGKPLFIAITNPVTGRQAGATGKIVFHCYDNHCFLSEFWTPTRETGSQLLPSRYEVELAKHRKGTEFALLDQPRNAPTENSSRRTRTH